MVGDNEVHAEVVCGLSSREGANACVHADDQPNASGGGALDYVAAKIVAFLNSVRNVKVRGAAA